MFCLANGVSTNVKIQMIEIFKKSFFIETDRIGLESGEVDWCCR